MARPRKFRRCTFNPSVYYFKPRGIPLFKLEEIVLERDELQAIKLSDYENLYQTEAAGKMKISRQTYGRILLKARMKIADGVISGKAIRLPEPPPQNIGGKFKHRCYNKFN